VKYTLVGLGYLLEALGSIIVAVITIASFLLIMGGDIYVGYFAWLKELNDPMLSILLEVAPNGLITVLGAVLARSKGGLSKLFDKPTLGMVLYFLFAFLLMFLL